MMWTAPGSAAPACRAGAGGAAVLVDVVALRDATGNVRVQLYGDKPDEFLEKDIKLKRVETPATAGGKVTLCVELLGPRTHALVALHDRNINGKPDVMIDGIGFSRNPKLTLAKPRYRDVAFEAGTGITGAIVTTRLSPRSSVVLSFVRAGAGGPGLTFSSVNGPSGW